HAWRPRVQAFADSACAWDNSRMKVGITLGVNWAGVPTPESFFDFIDAVEASPLDSLWVGDHIAWSNPTLEALTVLASYVARTKRLTVGTSVLIMPLRQP